MHIRSTAVLFTLALAGFGCQGSNYQPPPNSARNATPPAMPQETTSVSGVAGTPTENKAAANKAAPNNPPPTATPNQPHNAATTPPPAAGTSTPTQGKDAPYKPGSDQPPKTGGGPKPETGGSVYGDGNEGNTGSNKGGDPTQPPQK